MVRNYTSLTVVPDVFTFNSAPVFTCSSHVHTLQWNLDTMGQTIYPLEKACPLRFVNV